MRRGLLLLAPVVLAGACVSVPPAARGGLSKRTMQPALDGQGASWEVHVLENREGAAGATFAKGASCGCN